MQAKILVNQALVKVMPRLKNVESIACEDELYNDYGVDSRRFVYLIQVIEESMGCLLDDEILLEAEIITVKDMVNLVDQVLTGKRGGDE